MPCGIVECITRILNDTKFVHELECEGPEGVMAVVSSLSGLQCMELWKRVLKWGNH